MPPTRRDREVQVTQGWVVPAVDPLLLLATRAMTGDWESATELGARIAPGVGRVFRSLGRALGRPTTNEPRATEAS